MGGAKESNNPVLAQIPSESGFSPIGSTPASTHAGTMRPPTLRTRSTGGLLIATTSTDTSTQFDPADLPSPVLSPRHQGLAGLSESLAHLLKERRHSDTGVDDERNQSTAGQSTLQVPNNDNHFSRDQVMVELLHPPTLVSKTAKFSKAPTSLKANLPSPLKLSPQTTERTLKAPSKAGISTMSAPMSRAGSNSQTPTGGHSAMGMLRKASAEQPALPNSGVSSNTVSPPESGYSTPRMQTSSKGKKQVLETNHLQLQTHAPSGRRMINQYIIENELGRGVHGKVRLARDTETGERVAVKIVEREGKKRLGGGLSMGARGQKEEGSTKKDKEAERKGAIAPTSSSSTTRFPEELQSQIRPSSSDRLSPVNLAVRQGRWGSGPASSSASPEIDVEKQREKDRAMARKRQLWTTDKKVKREIALLKKCAHDNVVQLKEVIDDPSSKKIFMVLEFMEGGEVQWKDDRGFPNLTVDEARRTLRDVVLGLEYLHYQGIIHRDIKPANLLWDTNRRVKISDFGVSHFSYALLVASGGLPNVDSDEERMKDPSLVDDHELAKTAGSPAFFAPELCLAGEPMNTASSQHSVLGRLDNAEYPWKQQVGGGSPRQSNITSEIDSANKSLLLSSRKNRPPITKAIDVWALGVTLYCLLFGHVPFMADSEFALFAAIPREDYELPTFMGADRIRVGPRKKRWNSVQQWRDEEADVDPDDPSEREADVDPSSLSEEAHLVRDLLDRLLEKDPSKRIKLDEVKKHPWLVRDIADPPLWLSETDPAQLPSVQVTNEEVDGALTGFSKIKQTLKKFQVKLFAGLGVPQLHHHHHQQQSGIERPDSRTQSPAGGSATRRQRSKSASHAANPFLALSSHGEKAKQDRSSGTQSLVTTLSAPKASHSSRPHLFSRRQSTTMEKQSDSMLLTAPANEKSQSQPNSRPHSPSFRESDKMNIQAANQESKESHSERVRNAQPGRRPSSFFKRAASRGNELNLLRNKSSTDAIPPASSQDASRPSPKAGPPPPSTLSKGEQNNYFIRSSLESDPSHWSLVSASQSSHIAQPNIQPSRPRSRNRLGEVFRNVLGHHDRSGSQKSRSRPNTASSRGDLSSDRSQGGANPILLAPLTLASPEKHHHNAENSAEDVTVLRVPFDQVHNREDLSPRPVEVDDYDLDLDLSDDDLDEGKENRSHSILRNSGNGWRMERNDTSSTRNETVDSSVNLGRRTPSVEGGYNLFKPPYTGNVSNDEHDDPEAESYAMAPAHSDEAEALRRASAKESDLRKSHGDTMNSGLFHEVEIVNYLQGDNSAMTEDRFADAEEEDGHEKEISLLEEEDDDEDGGVSFKARARGHS